MKATLDPNNPIDQITLAALNPPMGDGKLYALDVPQVEQPPVPYATTPAPSHDDIVNAFDPNNKGAYSPSGVAGLYKYATDYGYRAGVTNIEPLIPNGTPSAATAPIDANTAPRTSNLIKYLGLGAIVYFGYKHFFKKHRG